MAKILLIETTTSVCSVGLSIDDKLSIIYEEIGNNVHAAKVPLFAQEILNNHKIDAVAISSGPGSYTGLRIGTSFAKGIAYGYDIPLISVPTLDAMASYFVQVYLPDKDNVIIPTIDARRMEIYTAIYDWEGTPLSETKPVIVDENTFYEHSNKKLILLGNGAKKTYEKTEHKNKKIVNILPSVRNMVTIAYNKFRIKKFEDIAYFEPFYLKQFLVTKSKKHKFN